MMNKYPIKITVKTADDAKRLADDKNKMYSYLHPIIMYISSDLYKQEKITCVAIYIEESNVTITVELDEISCLPVIDKYMEHMIKKEEYRVCAELKKSKERILERYANINS